MLFIVTMLLFLETSVVRAGPAETQKNETEVLIQHFQNAMQFIVAEDYFLGEDEWKLRNIYTSILKELGKEDDTITRYKGFSRMSNLIAFKEDLPEYLRSYLSNKADKALFMRRVTKILLQQDPYSQFFSGEDFKKSLRGQPYSDDGLIAGSQNRRLTVIAVHPESSADKAGLKPLDIIVMINDVDITAKESESDEDLEERAWGILTEHRDALKYTVVRNGNRLDCYTEFKKKDAEEKTGVNPKEVSWILDGEIGIITIKTFYSRTIKEQFLRVYTYLTEEKKVKGLVIDLRDNTGGYLFEAVAIASFFTTDENILVINKKTKRQFVKTLLLPGVTKFKGPVVVVVNSLTASASEMLTASLRQHGHIVVGSKTAGKNIAQIMRVLSDGSVILISTLSTSIPDGPDRMVAWGQGIIPDYETVFSEGKMNTMGLAKEKLRELLSRNETSQQTRSLAIMKMFYTLPDIFSGLPFMYKIYYMIDRHM